MGDALGRAGKCLVPTAKITAFICLVAVAVSGCASVPRKGAPCYDGWVSDGRGGSSRLLRDEALSSELREAFVPQDRALACAHVNFDGSIILLFFDPPGLRFRTVSREADGRFVVLEEGAVV